MKFAAYFVFIILLSLPLTSCAGTQAGAAETWAMVELLTVGERTDRALETVEVRNCGVVEQKTTSCSAGTSNDLSVSLGGSVGVSAVGVGDISGEVSTDLGVGRDSGQSLELETPPEGYVFHYTINTEYHVKAGEVLARSSSGEEQTLSYTFHASCALRIEMRETLSCEAPPPTLSSPTLPPAALTPPSTGDLFTRPRDGMVMVYVPAGEFTMGSSDGSRYEQPIHTVYLDVFWIDQTEVTNAMFAAFLNDQGNQSEGGATLLWLDADGDSVHIDVQIMFWTLDWFNLRD